jgi:hypothetical protein
MFEAEAGFLLRNYVVYGALKDFVTVNWFCWRLHVTCCHYTGVLHDMLQL